MKANANKILLGVVAVLVLGMLFLVAGSGGCAGCTSVSGGGSSGNAKTQSATAGPAAGSVATPGAAAESSAAGNAMNPPADSGATAGTAQAGQTGSAAAPNAAPNSAASSTGSSAQSFASSSSSAAAQPGGSANSGQSTQAPQAPVSSSAPAPTSQNAETKSDVAMTLVFDVSGSMTDSSALSGSTKLASAKKQSADFVSSVRRQKGAIGGISVRVGVCSFSGAAQTNCALSDDRDAINASINGLRANGQTNMFAGLGEGIDQLLGANGPRLMVFLSDGLSNTGGSRADILSLVDQAAAENIKIYTIGFGPSGSLDEGLLREIASRTGGSYSHEDSSNISSAAVGLYAAMMNAQLEATSQVLHSVVGSVKQGETDSAGTFDVTRNGTVQLYLYWPGSVLDLRLTDPDGTQVADGYTGYTVDTSSIPTAVILQGAKQGTWRMDVYGREVSMADEPYYAVAAFNETQASASGGGVASNNGEGLIFLVIVAALVCIGVVFAFTKRRSSNDLR